MIREQAGGEAEHVPALALHFDFTVKSGAAQGREAREMRRLLMNPRGLERGKDRESDTAHPFHLACVHGGDVLDLGRFHPRQILLRDHPAVENQGRPDSLKRFLELLQQPGDGRDVSRATGQHLPIKRDPVTTHHQSQHPRIVGAFLAVPPLHQHTARTAERGAGQVVEHGVHRRGPLACQAVEQMLAEGCLVVFDGGSFPKDTRGIDPMRWDRQEPGQGGIAKPVGGCGLGGGVETALEREEAGHHGQTQGSLARGAENGVQLPRLPDGIGDGDIEVCVTVRHRQVMERGEAGRGRFGSLQAFTPSPHLLIGELPELEDDVLAVRAIVPLGVRKAVGTGGGAFIVADSPMEVKRFQIHHVQFLDVSIFMKNSIHKENVSC